MLMLCKNRKMFFLSVLTVLTIQASFADKSVEIQLIGDYSHKQTVQTAVTAFLCWKQSDIFNLSKELNAKNVLIDVQNVNSKNINFHARYYNLFVLDLSCKNTLNILEKANKNNMFHDPNHWLIINNTNVISTDYYKSNLFKNLNVFVNSKVVLAQQVNQFEYYLEYVYKIHSDYDLIVDYFAYWNPNKLVYYYDEPLCRKRKNLRLHQLKVGFVVLNNDSFNHFTDYRQPELDAAVKLNYALTLEMLDFLNASNSKFIFFPIFYRVNTLDQNNTLLNAIYNNDVDITGYPFYCLPERLEKLDYIAMTTPSTTYFIFRQPPLSYVKNIYAMPFEIKLWLTHIAFYLVSAILLYLIVVWEWKLIEENNNAPDNDMIEKSFSDMLLFMMGALSQQGYAKEAKGTSGKILMLTIFFTLIFLFTAYTAYTVVLFQTTADDIKNLNDLYNSKIVLGVEDKVYLRNYFAKYKEPLRKKIYAEKIVPKGEPAHFYPREEGMHRVRHEYFAFYTSSLEGYRVIQDTFFENEKCGLKEMAFLDEKNPWIVAHKNHSFKKIFKIGYMRLQDSGINAREIKRRLTGKPKCVGQGIFFRSAGLIDLYPVYMLLIFGGLFSVIILFVEIVTHRYLNIFKNRFN